MNLKSSIQSLNRASQLNNILQLCSKQGFFQCIFNENEINNLSIGTNGALLQENLRKEWFYSTLTNNNINIFLNTNQDKTEAFNFARSMSQDKLPFGIATIINSKESNKSCKFQECFDKNERIYLISTSYVPPTNSIQFFHQSQRQRKMWWRKFSASPERYALTDLKSDENNNQSVHISAEYVWGTNVIESITLKPFCDVSISSEKLQFRDGRKKIEAHTVESQISLPVMLLNTLYDAYDEPKHNGESRPLFRFHRKLAPYKITFAITTAQSAIADELSQLALYLCKQLRANNISSLLLPNLAKQSLDIQWKHYDQLGIPYCILLNDSTLRNGLVHIRSRDTTLKEQVHITEIPKYVELLFKNY